MLAAQHLAGYGPGNLWKYLGSSPSRPFRPFPAQYEMLSEVVIPWPGLLPGGRPSPTIFGCTCGRRFGKTTGAEVLCWHAFTAPDDFFGPPTVRITADTFEHGQKIWDRFVWHAENTPLGALVKSHDRSRHLITGLRGETIQLLSADNPSALAGDGVTAWIVDEAQELSYPAFENLFPSTAERDGIIAMFGVAEHDGPFREVCYKGEHPEDNPEFRRMRYPTSANPYVPRWRIDFAKRMYTPERFKQLYLAEWTDDEGRVLRNTRGCVKNYPVRVAPGGWAEVFPPQPGHQYFGGLDLALHSDWCIYVISDRNGRVVAWDRFHHGSWETLKLRCWAISQHYFNPPTWVDSTGSGDPIYEDLLGRGLNVVSYQIGSNARKRQLVDGLAVRLSTGDLEYPPNPQMLAELERFSAHRSKTVGSNVVQYAAPPGMNDDWVIALALLCQGLPHRQTPVDVSMLNDPIAMADDEELRQMVADGYLFGPDQQTVNPDDAPRARQLSEADYI